MESANQPVCRERVAVTAVFLVNGAVFASLFVRLPAIKADLGLGDGQLGLVLLLAAVGLLCAQLAAGGVVARAGALAFCVLLAEGAVADWSAINLREGLGASQAAAASAWRGSR